MPPKKEKQKTPIVKSDWDMFKESETGKKCLDFETLTEAKYLESRLWWAFEAGRKSVTEQ